MATSKGVVNGVNVDTLFGVIDAVKGNPKVADFKFSITNKWSSGGHNITQIGNFYGALETQTRDGFTVENAEHPVLLGEDEAPNPVEFVLHALAGCLTTTLVYHSAARGYKITEINTTLEGNLDLHGFLGIDEKIRSGYSDIKVTMTVKGDLSEAQLQEMMQVAKDRSPVYDIVTHPVAVTVQMQK